MIPPAALPPGRALVTGGAGFLGSHLCERLLSEGWEVVSVDDFSTGSPENVRRLSGRPGYSFVEADVTGPMDLRGPFDAVCHLASPASPRDYMERPLDTLRAGSLGTFRCLDLAERTGARFLLASTSEIYGDPDVHPQPEGYPGRVSPTGPRSCYDESKRFAEAVASAYARRGLDVRIARIFNTMGPRMSLHDGRVVPTFVSQALRCAPLTIHGDGQQSRSLCYVDDLIDGLWLLLRSDVREPVNLGNPDERTVLEIAELVARAAEAPLEIAFEPRLPDDPRVRCPDITRARSLLGWSPRVGVEEGLARTVAWFRERLPRPMVAS